MKYISIAKKVFEDESRALKEVSKRINSDFEKALGVIYNQKKKIIILGVGKSGRIANKFQSSLLSIGIPSVFLHPTEAIHGDLGIVCKGDLVIIFSYSGNTNEIISLMTFLNKRNKIITITGNINSPIAKKSDIVLDVNVQNEVCPLNLAPTTSTTAMLVMSDALLVSLMKMKKTSIQNFIHLHPAGSIGNIITNKVSSTMIKSALPIVYPQTSFSDVIYKISKYGLGLVVVTKHGNEDDIVGIITDGDIRRMISKFKAKIFRKVASNIMTKKPKTIDENKTLYQAEKIMKKYNINSLLVLSRRRLVGILPFKRVK